MNSIPSSLEVKEHEQKLIELVETVHSPTNLKVKKAGALVLASLGAGFAFILQGLWSCGGLRKKWFVNLPEYTLLKKIWKSEPLSKEDAQKISDAFENVNKDYEKIFDTTFIYDTKKFDNDPRYRNFKMIDGKSLDARGLTSLTYNHFRELSSFVEELKKLQR